MFWAKVWFVSCLLPANSQDSGREICHLYCATCHGLDGRGGNASILFDDQWQLGREDGQININTQTGTEQNGMLGFTAALNEPDTILQVSVQSRRINTPKI